jgi:outer membrane biosynthesis protein TonB
MSAQADMFDERQSVGGYFLAALALHAVIFGGLAVYNLATEHHSFGAPNAGGAAVGVEAVKSLPLAHSGPTNPVANDTKSEIPQAPAKQEAVKERDIPPDAVRLKGRTPKKAATTTTKPRFRSFDELEPNQLTSTAPQAVSNPAFTATPGAGRVGTGANTTLGDRFPNYAAQIQQIIAQKWRTGDVDASVKTAPAVVATFEIMRDGRVRGLALLDKSGISTLDFSVQRAISEASPFPPLPLGFDKDSAKVELWFELKR